MQKSGYLTNKIIAKVLSCVIIASMLTGNVAWAAESVKNLDTLSPAVHLGAVIFQQGIKQFMQELTPAGAELTDLERIKQILSKDNTLGENPSIIKLLTAYEQAIEFKTQAEQYVKIAEHNQQKFNLQKAKNAIRLNQQLGNIENALLNALKAMDFSVNNIDLEKIRQILPRENNQILFEILRFKAEICLALADFYSAEMIEKSVGFYSEAKDVLTQAFSLSGVKIDFYAFAQMGTVYGRLGVTPKQSPEESLVLINKAITFFTQAQDQIKNLPDIKEAVENIENMYYTFFTIFHVAAVFAQRLKDQDQALRYYEQGEKLISHFSEDKTTVSRVNNFYEEYFRLLWNYALFFLEGANKLESEQQKKTKAAGIGFFIMSSRVAQAYLSVIPRGELTPQKEIEPLLCIIEANIEAAKIEFEINQDLGLTNAHLKQAAEALNKTNRLNIRDPYVNHSRASLNMKFIYQRTLLLKNLIRSGEALNNNFKIEKYFEPEFFGDFIARFNTGKYKKLFKTMNKAQDYSESFQELDQHIYRYSMINGFMKRLLQKGIDSSNKDFRKQFRYLQAITIAGLYIIDGEYAPAKKNIILAAGYAEKFKTTVSFREAILPQLILVGESGQDFMAELLSTHIKGALIEYFIMNKDKFTQEMRDFFTQVLNNPKNIKFITDERIAGLVEALELPVQILDLKALKAQKKLQAVQQVKPQTKPGKFENVIKTNDILIDTLERALRAIEQMKAPLRHKQKKKKKTRQLTKDSQEFKRFQKSLAEVIQTYEKLKSANLLTSIKELVQHPIIGQNVLLVRELTQALLSVETEEGLDVLGLLKEQNGFGAVKALKGELETHYQAQKDYLKRMDEFKLRCQELKQNLKQINVLDVFLSESQEKIQYLKARFAALLREFSDLASGEKGKTLIDETAQSFENVFNSLTKNLQQAQENKIQEYVQNAWNYEQELTDKFRKMTAPKLSQVEIIIALRQWQKQEVLILPDADIAEQAEVKQAQEKLQNQWQNIQKQISAAIEVNSYICRGFVKFEIAADLHFQGVKFPKSESYKSFAQEAVEVMRAVLKNNPQLDIEHQVTAAEFESVENWLIPLFESARQKVVQEKSVLQFAHDCEVKSKRQEQAINVLINEKLPQLQKIKAIEELLSDDYEELPEPTDEDMDSDHEIVMQVIKDFDEKIEYIQHSAEMLATVCKGLVVLSIEGDYESLFFTPKVEKINLNLAKHELHALWAEALSYNLDVQLAIPEDVPENAAWVKEIIEIWSEELAKAKILAQDKIGKIQESVETKTVTQQSNFIQSAI